MSLAIGKNIHESESSMRLLDNMEFQDYLLFESSSGVETENPKIDKPLTTKPTEINHDIDEIEVPVRSPRRPIRKNINYGVTSGKQNVSASPCSVLDNSSFEYRNDGSEKSSNDSIFSNEEILGVYHDSPILDEFGLDLSGIDDLDLFLNEIPTDENCESDIIFKVDRVIKIVAIHSESDIRPISYVDVK